MKKSLIPQQLIFLAITTVITISCKNKTKTENIQPVVSDSLTVADTTAIYADDPIDDSTLQFLDSLPASNISAYDIEMAKGISLATYSRFINLKNSNASFYKKGKISNTYIDSVRERVGLVGSRLEAEAEISAMKTVAAYYSSVSPAQQKWGELMAKLENTAIFLTTKTNFSYQDSANNPKQTGLAYLWGGKEYTVKTTPSLHKGVQRCPYKIYGLDCSGFVYTLLKKAGIKKILPGKAEDQRQVSHLKSILTPYFGEGNFDVKDMGCLTDAQVLNGDIAYRLNAKDTATHIGIILKDKEGKLNFAESHGSPIACDSNLLYGPTMSEVSKINAANYRIVRIMVK